VKYQEITDLQIQFFLLISSGKTPRSEYEQLQRKKYTTISSSASKNFILKIA